MKKPNDSDLIRSIIIYKRTGNLEPFIETAGIWAITFARDNFGISDGLETEMYFTIHKKRDESLKLFKENSLLKFPHFFNKYCKHLSFNLIRVHKKKKNESYLSLWNEGRQENPSLKDFREEKLSDLLKSIRGLSPIGKVIFCLRFNFELDSESKNIFEDRLKKKAIKPERFYENLTLRIQENNKSKEALMKKLNSLNRRIFLNEGCDLFKLKERKKHITKILERPTRYYSFKELAILLDIPVHHVNMILNNSIKKIRQEVNSKRAA